MSTSSSTARDERAVFISVDALRSLIGPDAPVVVLDARFDLATADAAVLAQADRIPGAVHVDVPSELAGVPTAQSGRLPLPALHDLERDARRWGIDQDSPVIVYDDGAGTLAARVWWVLRWAGLREVRILDGGYRAWKAAGQPLTREAAPRRRGNARLEAGGLPVADAAGILALGAGAVLLDARGKDAYVGKDGDAATGHIPGARLLPAGKLQDEARRVKTKEALLSVLAEAGIEPGTDRRVVAYCGSGVAAAYDVAVLRSVGIEAALYPGSWSEWVKDASRPVAWGE